MPLLFTKLGLGEIMRSFSLFKSYTGVWKRVFRRLFIFTSFTFTCCIYPIAVFAQTSNTPQETARAAAIRSQGEDRSQVRTLKDKYRTDCDQKKKEAADLKAQFVLVCKEKQRKEMAAAGEIGSEAALANRKKVIESCSKEFDECLSRGKEDLDIPGLVSSTPGMESFGAFSDALSGLGDEERRCSQYSATDHKAALKDAEQALKTENREIRDLTKELMTSQEKAQEDYERLQKEFNEAQQQKTKSDLDRKENARNQKAAFDKQISDYKAKINQINVEIAQLQEQMALQLRNKGSEVDNFKLELLGCKEQARLGLKGNPNQGASAVQPSGPQSNLLGATQSTSKQIYQICAGNAARKRQIASQEFNSKIKILQMNIDMKMRELASTQESAASFQDMFSKAMLDQQNARDAEDQAFLQQQSKAWQNLQSRVGTMQSKHMQNQGFLQKANADLNKASKRVAALEGETPPAGKKSADEIKAAMTSYEVAEAAAVTACRLFNETVIPEAVQVPPEAPAPAKPVK